MSNLRKLKYLADRDFYPIIIFPQYLQSQINTTKQQESSKQANNLDERSLAKSQQLIVAKSNRKSIKSQGADYRESMFDFQVEADGIYGKSEPSFHKVLESELSSRFKIYTQVKYRFNKSTHATLDFLLFDQELNIGLDLEIDEPYSFKDQTPCHTLEDPWYPNRDRLINQRNLIVCRLAEHQVIKYPLGCLSLIKSIFSFIDGSAQIDMSLEEVDSWSTNDSKFLANHQYRTLLYEGLKVG